MLKWAENEVKLACSRERATENDITGGMHALVMKQLLMYLKCCCVKLILAQA